MSNTKFAIQREEFEVIYEGCLPQLSHYTEFETTAEVLKECSEMFNSDEFEVFVNVDGNFQIDFNVNSNQFEMLKHLLV